MKATAMKRKSAAKAEPATKTKPGAKAMSLAKAGSPSRAKAGPKAKPKPAPKDASAASKAKIKTTLTGASIDAFIATVDSEARRADAQALVKLFKRISGWQPRMWGPAIVGFGAYHYTYASGHSGSICALGFSPRKANFAIYVADFPDKEALLATLGKHKGGLKQCLYINRVDDIDQDVLGKILAGGLAELKKQWPVTAA